AEQFFLAIPYLLHGRRLSGVAEGLPDGPARADRLEHAGFYDAGDGVLHAAVAQHPDRLHREVAGGGGAGGVLGPCHVFLALLAEGGKYAGEIARSDHGRISRAPALAAT